MSRIPFAAARIELPNWALPPLFWILPVLAPAQGRPKLPFKWSNLFWTTAWLFTKGSLQDWKPFAGSPNARRPTLPIGYCLGGCGVLELARSGADLRGVVSLHGILDSPLPAAPGTIMSKILVLHGDEDPIASLDELVAFRNEMRLARANWEIVIYGGARHGFTGEGIIGDAAGEARLHPQSEKRSWQATIAFLNEALEKL